MMACWLMLTGLAILLSSAHSAQGHRLTWADKGRDGKVPDHALLHQDRAANRVPVSWELNYPTLEIAFGELRIQFIGTDEVKNAKFFMSINQEFRKFCEAEFLIQLSCNRENVCEGRLNNTAIYPCDLVHYGMKVKLKRERRTKFLGIVSEADAGACVCISTGPTNQATTGGPTPASCSDLFGPLPQGYAEEVYSVPTGFLSNYSGHGNPERGFYQISETKTSSWTALTTSQLETWVEAGYMLVSRNIMLDTFVSSNISESVIDLIHLDLNAIWSAGLKVILNFYYTDDLSNPEDASPDQVAAHIEQLAPVLQDRDLGVIAAMHAGFIGTRGDWFFTNNYGDQGDISPQDWEKRRGVVNNLLRALHSSRQVLVNTPFYKRTLLNRNDPLSRREAYSDTQVARIGHHNECFLGTETDFGTFVDKAAEYPYLQHESQYLVVGGQTCYLNKPRSSCSTALRELQELHYTYLNGVSDRAVLDDWEAEGCLDQIRSSLGYRLVALRSRFPSTASPGETIAIGLTLRNMGFAAPISYRMLQLVLRHLDSGEELYSPVDNVDVRDWHSGDHSLQMTFDLPSSAATGQYKILLDIYDAHDNLQSDRDYRIEIENLIDTASPTSRRNLLGELTVV